MDQHPENNIPPQAKQQAAQPAAVPNPTPNPAPAANQVVPNPSSAVPPAAAPNPKPAQQQSAPPRQPAPAQPVQNQSAAAAKPTPVTHKAGQPAAQNKPVQSKQTHSASKASSGGSTVKIAAVVFAVLFLVATTFAVVGFVQASSAKAAQTAAAAQLGEAESQLAALQQQIEASGSKMPIFDAYARFIVFDDESVYHNYDCPIFQSALSSGEGWMLVDKEYAEVEYNKAPCPQCGG